MLIEIRCYECVGVHVIEVDDVFSLALDSWVCDRCADDVTNLDEDDGVTYNREVSA